MEYRDKLTVIIGPSGSGKSTHVAELLRRTDAELIRTETDRPRRDAHGDDTHTFVSPEVFTQKLADNHYLGHGSMFGYNYGLPHLPETPTPKIVLLRAPFVPEVWQHRPDATIVQFEADPHTLANRLAARGDQARGDIDRLALETAMGHKLTSYIVSTEAPFEQSFAQFMRIWNEIQSK